MEGGGERSDGRKTEGVGQTSNWAVLLCGRFLPLDYAPSYRVLLRRLPKGRTVCISARSVRPPFSFFSRSEPFLSLVGELLCADPTFPPTSSAGYCSRCFSIAATSTSFESVPARSFVQLPIFPTSSRPTSSISVSSIERRPEIARRRPMERQPTHLSRHLPLR